MALRRLMKVFQSLGVQENEQIEHKMLSSAIEKAQMKIEIEQLWQSAKTCLSTIRSTTSSVRLSTQKDAVY